MEIDFIGGVPAAEATKVALTGGVEVAVGREHKRVLRLRKALGLNMGNVSGCSALCVISGERGSVCRSQLRLLFRFLGALALRS